MSRKKKEWRNVTDCFTEDQRHYNGKYLEIDEVYDEVVEVSLFSSETGLYEIYISFGNMVGIIYAEKEKAYDMREEIKKAFEEEYKKNKEPSGKFVDEIDEKYGICLPDDLFFDLNMEDLFKMF